MADRQCPLIGKIKEEICFDINMVADDLAPEGTIPKEILKIENYKKVCQECKFHNKD